MVATRLLVALATNFFVACARTFKKEQGNVPVSEIQPLVDKMRQLDCRSARLGDITLLYQGKTSSHDFKDVASDPLFNWVQQSMLTSQTYSVYFSMPGLFNPDVNVPESQGFAKETVISSFLNAVMNTGVFNVVWQYLQSKNLASSDYSTMKQHLMTMWFGLYSRSKPSGTLGSSGFEHVFLGEHETSGDVGGQHHWARFYHLENNSNINYYGYIEYDGFLQSTIQYTWGTYRKPIGGFLVGTTVEFDFSLFTLCWLMFPNSENCKFKIDGYPTEVQTWTEGPQNQYVASTYPKIAGSREVQ